MKDYTINPLMVLVFPDTSKDSDSEKIMYSGEEDDMQRGTIVAIGESLKKNPDFKFEVGQHIEYVGHGPFNVFPDRETDKKYLIMAMDAILVGQPMPEKKPAPKPRAKKTTAKKTTKK